MAYGAIRTGWQLGGWFNNIVSKTRPPGPLRKAVKRNVTLSVGRFGRRGRRGAFRRKRMRFKRRRNGRRSFKRRVRRVVCQISQHKYLDAATAALGVDTAAVPIYSAIGSIAQGDTISSREGDRILLRSWNLNMNFGAGTGLCWVRVIVGCHRDKLNAASFAASDLMQSTTNYQISPYNREPLERKEWIPMYDKTFLMQGTNAGLGAAASYKKIQLMFSGKRLPMKSVRFNNAGTPDHNYFWLVYSNLVPGATAPSFQTQNRYTWVDV